MSFLLIYIVHYLINYFKANLTIPKTKDLVNAPPKKYEHMYNIINHRNNTNTNMNTNTDTTSMTCSNKYTLIDLLPVQSQSTDNEDTTMKDELKQFLKSQLHQ